MVASPQLKWVESGQRIAERVDEVLVSWEGTPYMRGQRCKGAGVDCLRYVCAVLDELNGFDCGPVPNIPQDASMHDPELARATMRSIMEAYGPADTVDDGSVEPGDVVVTGPKNGGPGHAVFVGGTPNTMWHASPPRVQRIGMTMPGFHRVFRVYRSTEKWRWVT